MFSINPSVRSLYLTSFLHFVVVLRPLRAAFESPSRALCRRSSWVNHHRLPLSQPPVKSKSGGVWVSLATGRLQKHRPVPRPRDQVARIRASRSPRPDLQAGPLRGDCPCLCPRPIPPGTPFDFPAQRTPKIGRLVPAPYYAVFQKRGPIRCCYPYLTPPIDKHHWRGRAHSRP